MLCAPGSGPEASCSDRLNLTCALLYLPLTSTSSTSNTSVALPGMAPETPLHEHHHFRSAALLRSPQTFKLPPAPEQCCLLIWHYAEVIKWNMLA